MNYNSMTSCVISYACVGCYLGVLDESVLDLLSPEHIYPNVRTQMINTNNDKNMYNIQMFPVY